VNERNDNTAEEQQRVVIRDKRRLNPETGEPRHAAPEPEETDETEAAAAGDGPKPGFLFEPRRKTAPSPGVAALQRKLAERTSDLQRVTAEYANYRKRVERDRAAAAEAGTSAVLAALLPVLDNLDRAREHGDLTGAFKAVADQIGDTLTRLGLEAFGKEGDAFDPMIHEAVAHQTSTEVSEPTCVSVMRVGYRHGERLLRPALVAVADPAEPRAGGPSPATEGAASGADDTQQ
jgi:molecular chaperone GrpE